MYRPAVLVVLVASALSSRAGSAAPPPKAGTTAVDVPAGTVAFFATAACPSGWAPAKYAAGRLVVATTHGVNLRRQVGTALKNAEDRAHAHAFETKVSINFKEIAGAESCCNGRAAKAGTYTTKGETGEASSGLPFVQLVICEKSAVAR